jgi:hypothetical protein
MRRREFIAGLGSVAAWPSPGFAQQGRLRSVGYLGGTTPAVDRRRLEPGLEAALVDSARFGEHLAYRSAGRSWPNGPHPALARRARLAWAQHSRSAITFLTDSKSSPAKCRIGARHFFVAGLSCKHEAPCPLS